MCVLASSYRDVSFAGKLQYLEVLDLHNNELEVLPQKLGNCAALVSLFVDANANLLSLPTTLSKLMFLQNLTVDTRHLEPRNYEGSRTRAQVAVFFRFLSSLPGFKVMGMTGGKAMMDRVVSDAERSGKTSKGKTGASASATGDAGSPVTSGAEDAGELNGALSGEDVGSGLEEELVDAALTGEQTS